MLYVLCSFLFTSTALCVGVVRDHRIRSWVNVGAYSVEIAPRRSGSRTYRIGVFDTGRKCPYPYNDQLWSLAGTHNIIHEHKTKLAFGRRHAERVVKGLIYGYERDCLRDRKHMAKLQAVTDATEILAIPPHSGANTVVVVGPEAVGAEVARRSLKERFHDVAKNGRVKIERPKRFQVLTPNYDGTRGPSKEPSPGLLANVVVSKLPNGKHAVCLDIDHECELVPSKTPGHYHLYIDVEVDSKPYFDMLDAMAVAGVLEKQYAVMSRKQGETTLRLPDPTYEWERVKEQIEKEGIFGA